MAQHWTERHIGMEWTEDFNCVRFVEYVYLEEGLGIVTLPNERRLRKMDPEDVIDNFGHFATPVWGNPAQYDLCLMGIVGKTKCLGSHVGVVAYLDSLVPNSSPWVLHSTKNTGSVLWPVSQLKERFSLEVKGYYSYGSLLTR